jgi:hypothetical protein
MSLAAALLEYASSGGKSITPITRALSQRSPRYPSYSKQSRGESAHADHGEGGGEGAVSDVYQNGELLVLPRTWKGTHNTDGLTAANRNTAIDIMAKAGTTVGAPEPGRIEYFRPTGAQGGGSMLFDPDAPGPDYWIGHIAKGLAAGTRVRKRGQRIALISPDHAAPHAHVDRVR